MRRIPEFPNIGAAFAAAVAKHGPRPFLAVPADAARSYLPDGLELSYAGADAQITALAAIYRAAGYGLGHRVATLLENRPDHVLHKLALNSLGACVVPINPEYRPGEIAYLLAHSEPELIVTLADRERRIGDALAENAHRPPVALVEAFPAGVPRARTMPAVGAVTLQTPACVLYTSGTTGRPKGCVLSHDYELSSGARYATLDGVAALRTGQERIYNPLPLYHVNSGTLSLVGAILSGNCQIQAERFHPKRWWREIAETRATVVHYLGVIAAMLLNGPPDPEDRAHSIRFGIGAGIEPQLHRSFEDRFGFPMVEVWGMTEMVRLMADDTEPRQVGTRAFGRAYRGLDVRVVDDTDRDVADDQPGEMLVRHSAAIPRRGFFSCYLKDDAATEAVWRGGWFHTGDVVRRDADGMVHFVDRKKNIIRRSGENIAAAEIEALLLTHPNVAQAAVMAVKDEVREEEVLACVVLKREDPDAALSLFRYCHDHLAYYKTPGWIHILKTLPTTGTQKIQKHVIYPDNTDPRTALGVVDLRARKRRVE
ncbi:MAG: long-chain fatty acid--CoA ligase [Acetobacteraceae bacterium]|nr:long-chain fatty acid--CoA ligase [Acetobacteraceae bacterium]MSP29407.1 long-chain fatty acid--CoA ligase [Acetobacteraceae bacterium]